MQHPVAKSNEVYMGIGFKINEKFHTKPYMKQITSGM